MAKLDFLEKLNPRERLFLQGLVIFLLILGAGSILRVVVRSRSALHEEAMLSGQRVAQMLRVEKQIVSLPAEKEIPDMNLLKSRVFALLEKYNLKGDIKDSVQSLSRSEELMSVNISINGTPLQPVISFLYEIEYGGAINATIGDFQFTKPLPERDIYDVRISVGVRRPRGK